MEIIIKNKIIPPVHKNEYKFVLRFMEGDADGWQHITLFADKVDKDLEKFIVFLDKCENTDEYYSVDNFELFAGDRESRISFHWPCDCHSGEPHTLYSYELTYFDESGDEFNVEIK